MFVLPYFLSLNLIRIYYVMSMPVSHQSWGPGLCADLGCVPIGCGWAGDVPESTAESTVQQVGYGGMVGWWEVPLVMLWKRPNTRLLVLWLRHFSAMFEWGRASPFSFLASVDILMNYIIFVCRLYPWASGMWTLLLGNAAKTFPEGRWLPSRFDWDGSSDSCG